MGNLVTLCTAKGSVAKAEKMLQIMKTNDGKILEFRASMRVKDLLINHPNCYVGMFRDATLPLPLDYKLNIGKIYYLLPSFSTTFEPKRIKVVITRQQLQLLMSDQIKVGIKKRLHMSCSLAKPCLEKLESIPEEIESVY